MALFSYILYKIEMRKSAETPPAFSPLYRQIKALILQGLQRGDWKPGETIPSEIELAQQYRVSQGTVRKAIDELAADHLLMRRQGRGTFVATHAEQHVQYRFLRLMPDVGTLDDEGPAQRRICLCARERATADIARALRLRTGDGVMHVQRVLLFSGVATILEDLWLPGTPFKRLHAEQLERFKGPTYALYEEQFGISMVRAEEKLKAVMPTPAESSLLEVAPGTALLQVERLAYTYNDQPMELRRALYRTDRRHYRNTLS